MSEGKPMTVGELRERLDECDPSAKVVLLSTDREDMSWALESVYDDERGDWVMLHPGREIPVTIDDDEAIAAQPESEDGG